MSADYKVILGDLGTMAGKFDTESTIVAALSGDLAHQGVATGDSQLDGMLAAALSTLRGLNAGIARKLGGHAVKLRESHDSYHSTDSDHARLLDSLMKAAEEDA